MKKLVTAVAACVMAGAVFAVESVNVVGYVTRALDNESGIFSLGVSLKNMGTQDGGTVVSNANFFGTTLADYDTVLVLNTSYLAFDAYQYVSAAGGWLLTPGEGGEYDIPVASFTIPLGASVYCATAAGEVLVPGEVAASGTAQVVFDTNNESSGVFQLANPYPVETKLSDLGGVQDYDTVLVLNTDYLAFDSYQYVSAAGGWLLTPGEGGQYDLPVASSTVAMPVSGSAFFVPSASPRTLTFTLAY